MHSRPCHLNPRCLLKASLVSGSPPTRSQTVSASSSLPTCLSSPYTFLRTASISSSSDEDSTSKRMNHSEGKAREASRAARWIERVERWVEGYKAGRGVRRLAIRVFSQQGHEGVERCD